MTSSPITETDGFGPASSRLHDQLELARRRVLETHGKAPGLEIARRYADDIDDLICAHSAFLAESAPEFAEAGRRFALVALGGYARSELNLYSDVDIAFLFEGDATPEDEEFIKAFVYPFWNLKVDLGYSLKTVQECLDGLDKDLETTTSLMGCRFVWGNAKLHGKLIEGVRRHVHVSHGASLLQQVSQSVRARHERHSNTVLLLEPNIKEAPGGLRDIHTMGWAAFAAFGRNTQAVLANRGLLTSRESDALRTAHSFLIDVRNGLHILEGRKTDVLTVDRQIRLAAERGYERREHLLPEEQLMRAYYTHAGEVDRLLRRTLRQLDALMEAQEGRTTRKRLRSRKVEGDFWGRGEEVWVEPKDAAAVTRDPGWMMHLITTMTIHGLQPDEFTLNLVTENLAHVNDEFRRQSANRDRWLMILGHRRNGGKTLRAMHQCGFLDAYMPEFGLVRNLPRIDYYHHFTVDEHLLRAVDCAIELVDEDSPLRRTHAGRVASDILRWDLLVFAILFHDVGKGEGRGHVMRGAQMIERIAERIGMRMKERHILRDLVLEHQKMSHLAFKRDVDDPRIAEQLGRDLGSRELLRMLYVLTCCDVRAVSRESWNDWRASLLAHLYEGSMAVLQGKDHVLRRSPSDHREAAERVMKELCAAGGDCPPDLDVDDIREFIGWMPDRYLAGAPPPLIAMHLRLSRVLTNESQIAWEIELPEGCNYAVLHSAALDQPGLFANLCGALSSRGLNILSAQIYTGANGVCIDVFQVQKAGEQPEADEAMLERLRVRVNEVLRGQREAHWSKQMPRDSTSISSARIDLRPPDVTIHDDESRYSVVEIKAPDRPGLLHDIARCFDRRRLQIHLALVSTESYQVVDVFYVTDWENNRLEPGPAMEAFRKDLLETVSPVSVL